MVWFGKNIIKFVGALIHLIKLLRTKKCTSATVREQIRHKMYALHYWHN